MDASNLPGSSAALSSKRLRPVTLRPDFSVRFTFNIFYYFSMIPVKVNGNILILLKIISFLKPVKCRELKKRHTVAFNRLMTFPSQISMTVKHSEQNASKTCDNNDQLQSQADIKRHPTENPPDHETKYYFPCK
jgi:hypothetical protein